MERRSMIIAEELDQELISKIKNIIPDWNVYTGKDSTVWEKHIQDAEVIAGWNKQIAESCLQNGTKLKWIQSWSAGVDSYPIDSFAKHDILLTSANGVHAFPISETIFAMMLSLTRKIHAYVQNMSERVWKHESLKLELHNKTIGILGVGAIGTETAKIAKAFGMHVIGIRNAKKPASYFDEIATMDELHDLLPKCDYVVVTLPLTDQTYHIFGEEAFNKMKDSSFFINIGRGQLVDEPALIKALQEKQIAGAGCDVFEQEPLPYESPLWNMDNVIITPHTAGSTEYYHQRVVDDILIPNLLQYLNGHTPSVNLVDYKRGY
ncbi:D-2-hydroxyacid dehydrogenase [Aquibacillus koreensis]|uniref:D-2-hydroxyacid dehydrogenase n=1 Tax=Aquibacillus koreensis TaxID=279446 RepID=A0A9X3WI64_9BACI|nr:D-2-hydroxyacid dehydrogenase [Aquibacillus koreensis]MCT2537489.1 D-2-hydroxyacid dehydrogenase [Aquibacillus koreensis]MDC3418935.1 D-2-hydroxyacid dehydrogenase [Aquibacillus koreensis]